MTVPVMRPWLGEEEARAAAEAIRSGWVSQGPRVAEFERAFAEMVGVSEAVAVSSCTAALHLALVVSDIGPGDDVVVPSFSFIATANSARYVGARPVFADVDITGNLTATSVQAALTPRTRAVIVVDQGGVPADVEAIRAVCDPLGIVVIEDAACAAGSTYHGHPVGRRSTLAAWSFHPRKLITTGEGGMVTTDDPRLARRLRRLREHGMSVSAAERHASAQPVIESYLETGFNYRMTDIQAAVGLVQLTRLPEIVRRRRELAARYHSLLANVRGTIAVTDPPWGTSNFQSFWVAITHEFAATRNGTLRLLADNGVSARRGIMAAHLEPAFAHHDTGGSLSVTEWLTSRSLILPLYQDLTEADQDRIVEVLSLASSEAVVA